MVDLVGIDVNMSNITNMKILILVPSTALTVCFIEPLSAVQALILFIWTLLSWSNFYTRNFIIPSQILEPKYCLLNPQSFIKMACLVIKIERKNLNTIKNTFLSNIKSYGNFP